jgi:hypothetical protein
VEASEALVVAAPVALVAPTVAPPAPAALQLAPRPAPVQPALAPAGRRQPVAARPAPGLLDVIVQLCATPLVIVLGALSIPASWLRGGAPSRRL